MSLVPFINLKENTYSESVGNNSPLLTEDYVKQILLGKEVKSDEMLRFSTLMFYYVNASSVTLNHKEFNRLLKFLTGSPATLMIGLHAVERLIRINQGLVNNTNVQRYFDLIVEISKNALLNEVSLRLIAISLEVFQQQFCNFNLKNLLKSLVRLPNVNKERLKFYNGQCLLTILEHR